MSWSSRPGPDDARRIADIEDLERRGAVEDLVAALDTPSWMVRRRVIAALGAIGAPAVEPLCRLLRERRDDESRIAAAVEALAVAVGDDDGPVVALTTDPNPAVVIDGVLVLTRARSPGAVPTLVRLVDHEDDNVALSAIEGLGNVGGRAALAPLVATVRSGNFFRVFPAIDVLGRTGDPRAIEPLVELLPDPRYTLEVVRALGRTGDRAAVEPLVGVLHTAPMSLVRVVVLALADLQRRYADRHGDPGPIRAALRSAAQPSRIVGRLARALESADDAEARAIATLLGALGSTAAEPHLLGLIDARPAVTEAAAEALEELGRASERALVEAVRSGSSERRRALIPRLRAGPAAVGASIESLTDPDPEVRALACEVLGRAGDPSVVPRLFPLLADPNPRVAQAVTGAIQALGSAEARALTLGALRAADRNVRRSALRIAGFLGLTEAFDEVAAAARDEDPRIRDAAIQALALVEHPGARGVLLDQARSEAPEIRAVAMRSLGHFRPDPQVIDAVRAGLRDPAPWVRYYAGQALGRLQPDGAGRELAALLTDAAPQVRLGAIDALAEQRDPEAMRRLAGVARSDDPDTRRAALLGLGLAGDHDVVDLLLEALADDDPATRLVAVSALRGRPDGRLIARLAQVARDPDQSVRLAAIDALAHATDGDAARALVGLLEDHPDSERILVALSRWSPERGAALVDALATAGDELAPALTSALARMRCREADDLLVQALALDNVAARKAAATQLGERLFPAAVDALKRAAATDASPEVRQLASLALARRS